MNKAQERNEPPRDPEEDSLGGLIDDLCDQFEARWKAGERPRIEDLLGHVADEHRRDLLTHLLGVELHWRRRNSETPSPDEYTQRFPQDRETIDDLFSEDDPSPSVTNNQAETVFLRSEPQSSTVSGESRQLGSYRLEEELGRGGMGVVYRAWQASADRFVALKLIRRDRLESLPRDRQAGVIHRFEHEAQAAGRIEHDHIVTVYEVGEINGEHFFSMRYVEGQSLTDLLQDGSIDGRRAAAYLEPVARAVHEAHLHGILHRDLKPQNILVDAKTDRAMVVDFGLAKLAEGAEGMTEAGDVMGTPPYMSPEQAKDSSQVTAKSDVYGLGATLYHAVAGRPPFQANSVLETIRLVADETPLPPRQIDPQIDLDLETICLKCLEKDPTRRYASAEAFADELRRYLKHEPIEARPLNALGRGARWCRRYPVVASLLCCTIVFFMAALAASIVGYVQTSTALAVSERNYQWARDTVDRFYTRVSEEWLLNQPGMQPLRQELLELALSYYERFAEERGDDPTVRDELAVTAYRLGRITEQLGSVEKAEQWYRRALKIQEELVAQRPQDPQLRQALGDTLIAMGGIFLAQKNLEEAKASYQRAAEVRQQLVDEDYGDCELQRKLANAYMNLGVVARESGDPQEARRRITDAQAIRHEILTRDRENMKTRRDLAKGCFNLANLCISIEPMESTGTSPNLEEALSNLEEALGLFEELLTTQPNDQTNQKQTAVTALQYGDLLWHLERPEEARQPYQRALELMRHLAYLNPDVPNYRFDLARTLMNLGTVRRGQTPDANAETADHFAEARWILEELVAEYQGEPKYKRDLGATLWAIGTLSLDMGDQESALQLLEQAQQYFKELCRDYPENGGYAQWLKDLNRRLEEVRSSQPPPEPDESADSLPEETQ